MKQASHPPPLLALTLLRLLLPYAERAEVLADVREEHARRAQWAGPRSADAWVWRQVLSSVPALLRRGWWRGTTGFEPEANRLQPGGPMFESWIMDVRYSARRLVKRPLYAVLAVTTLALGIGGAGAIFTIVRGLLLNPLPYANEQELVMFWNPYDWSESEFVSLHDEFAGFSGVTAYRPEDVTLLSADGSARLVTGISSSADVFDVLGARPLLGRGFRAGDDELGAEPVAVISWGLWRELGADPGIVGARLTMDGSPRTVVGVMPKGFWFPDPATRIWLAESLDPENRSGNYVLVGRMSGGTGVPGMAGPLARITALLAERFEYPAQWDKTKNAALTPIRDFVSGPVRPALLATLAAMGAILLMACANVAALMLGQVDGRSTELAVRSALGAGRRRLLQQLVAEALLVGLLAGTMGALVASVGMPVLLQSLPLGALTEGARADWTLLITANVIAVGAAVLVAMAPVWTVWRGELRGAMGTRGTGMGGRGGKLESGLVVAEVALAVLMASGAALLIRSVNNLGAIDPGVNTRNVAVVDVAMPGNATGAERTRMAGDVMRDLAGIPGVQTVAATSRLPLRGGGDNWGIRIASKPDLASSTTAFRQITPDYFAAMGLELREGRLFAESDRAGAPVIVINEALAEKYFPGENPLGQQLLLGDQVNTIIGIVENAAEANLTDGDVPARYMLYEHVNGVNATASFVLRVERDRNIATILDEARRRVQAGAPGSAVQNTTTMENVFASSMGPVRQVMMLLTLLSSLALVLGAVGVYGVIAHFVARRKRDIGIRLALGLRPARVVGRIIARGGALVGAGIAAGIVASLFLTRIVGSLLYGVGTTDPTALAAATATLLIAGLAAAAIPAWRASRMDPARVLRE